MNPPEDIKKPQVAERSFMIGDSVGIHFDGAKSFIIDTILEPNGTILYFTFIGTDWGRPGYPQEWLTHKRMVLIETTIFK